MKNIKRKEEGVSPVIATILMVAITVVLAATLYMMLPSGGGGDATEAMSGRVREVSDGYIVEIDSGSVEWDADKPRLYNTSSGKTITSDSWDDDEATFSADEGDVNVIWNDNDDNGEISSSDTFKITSSESDGVDFSASNFADNHQFRVKDTSLQLDLD